MNNINGGAWFGKNADPYSEKQIRKRICDPFNNWRDFFKRNFPLKRQNTLFQDCEMIVKDISRLFNEGKMTNHQLDNLLSSPDIKNEAAGAFRKKLFDSDEITVTESLAKTYSELSNFVNHALPGPEKSMEAISRGWTVEGIDDKTTEEEKEKIWKTSRDLYRTTLAQMKEPQLEKLIESLKLSVRTILDSNKDQNSAALSALMSSKWLKNIIDENFQKNQASKGDDGYIPCGNSGVADLDCIVNEEELSVLLNDSEINEIKQEATIANIPAFDPDNLETALNKWWWSPESNVSDQDKNVVENVISNLMAGTLIPYHKDLRLGLKLLVKESKIKKKIMLDELKKESEEKRQQMRTEKRDDATFNANLKNVPFMRKTKFLGREVVDRKAQSAAEKEANAQQIKLKELELKEQSNVKTTEVITQQTELLKGVLDGEFNNLKEVLISKMEQRIEEKINMLRLPQTPFPSPSPDNQVAAVAAGGKSKNKKKSKSKSISVKSKTKRKKRTKKRTRRNKKNRSSKNNSSK